MTHDVTREKRQMVQVRLGQAGVARLDALAEEVGVNRSEVIRAALSIALARPEQLVAHLEAKKQSRW